MPVWSGMAAAAGEPQAMHSFLQRPLPTTCRFPPINLVQAVGRTRHNKLCYFHGDGVAMKGQLVDVHVDRVHAYTLYGSMLY